MGKAVNQPRIPSLAALRAFEAVARNLSFTRAADELRITQGAVSYQIKQLVSELGVPLFRWDGRVLVLTEEARKLQGEVVPMDAAPGGKGRMAMTVREPLGVIAAITPFNFPLNLTMHKLGPALAGGNAVVHKPASATPLTALRLQEAVAEAGGA